MSQPKNQPQDLPKPPSKYGCFVEVAVIAVVLVVLFLLVRTWLPNLFGNVFLKIHTWLVNLFPTRAQYQVQWVEPIEETCWYCRWPALVIGGVVVLLLLLRITMPCVERSFCPPLQRTFRCWPRMLARVPSLLFVFSFILLAWLTVVTIRSYLQSSSQAHSPPIYPVSVSDNPIIGRGNDYFAIGHFAGPQELVAGSSHDVSLTLSVTNGTATSASMKLASNEVYSARASLQAPSFEFTAPPDVEKPVSTTHTAQWAWVITPKEKHLGSQIVLADVFLRDSKQTNVVRQIPYLRCSINVTGPFGLPAWAVDMGTIAMALLVSIGTVLGILKGWKELKKRQRRNKKPEQDNQHKPEPPPQPTTKDV